MQTHDAPEPGARSPRNANYDIDVRLDHAARTLSGRQTIRWRNTSAKPTSELQFHLYWNAWRNADSTWLRERSMTRNYTAPRPDGWGAMDVSAVRLREPSGSMRDLTSQMRFIAPDDGNALDRTVMAVPLGLSVEPNETIQVELAWTAQDPAAVRAHRLHRATSTSSPSGSRSSACSKTAAGTRTSSTRPPSSTPTSASTTCASPSRHRSSSAPRDVGRRARTTATGRRRTGITTRTSTTSRGRRAPTTSI